MEKTNLEISWDSLGLKNQSTSSEVISTLFGIWQKLEQHRSAGPWQRGVLRAIKDLGLCSYLLPKPRAGLPKYRYFLISFSFR